MVAMMQRMATKGFMFSCPVLLPADDIDVGCSAVLTVEP